MSDVENNTTDYFVPPPTPGRLYTENLMLLRDQMRKRTIATVNNLTTAQIDRIPFDGANSIAAILRHVACLTEIFNLRLFEGREFIQTEVESWSGALPNLPLRCEGGRGVGHYLDLMAASELRLSTNLRTVDDQWLLARRINKRGLASNCYYILFHLTEDEISHRGQIRMLKRLIISAKAI